MFEFSNQNNCNIPVTRSSIVAADLEQFRHPTKVIDNQMSDDASNTCGKKRTVASVCCIGSSNETRDD